MSFSICRSSRIVNRIRNLKIQRRNYGGHDDHHMTRLQVDQQFNNLMDKLPQPKGAWKDLDAKRQAVNNATFIIGITLLVSSVVGTAALGMWKNTLFNPPYKNVSKDFPGAKFVD